jgi:glycosyltransferase involved in cell wall biosynthesis
MSRPRTNICLNMIVKNEVAVLPRLFRSLKDFIDYYVIVDTGSTDDTIALIKREMDAYGIEGEVHERPWVNFGTNRQQALELAVAAGKTEWLLFIDADEELETSDPKFFEKLEAGVSYNIEKHHAGLRYSVPHLLNVRAGRYKWEGPVHNHITTLAGPTGRVLRQDVWIIYHSGEGAKSHGLTLEEKYLRDARLLEEDLKKNPENTRSQFYLAQSYRDAGHLEKAYIEYQKRATMKGWAEETFVAQLEAGKLAVRLEKPDNVVLAELLSAYNLRPLRAEPLHDLARYFRLKKQYSMAFLFARAGAATNKPNDSLFLAQSVYDWKLLDELAVSAYWVKDYQQCKTACETVLKRIEEGLAVPTEDADRVKANFVAANEKLGLDSEGILKSSRPQ